MAQRILITGGAGFIGSYVADQLLAQGRQVRVLDSLIPQVHGPHAAARQQRPDYLDPRVELHVGDVRDRHAVRQALHGVEAVIHLAAMVGVGQSMYQLERYTAVNGLGTAVLLEEIVNLPRQQVTKLVVASSMSIYGEGLYLDSHGQTVQGMGRTRRQLDRHVWEVLDDTGRPLTPIATPESKHPELASIYALGKYEQERMCLLVGQSYKIPTVALRFFNAYGPRQALSNPYTGVLAIFGSRLLNGRAPLIYEDGFQQRDFVHVTDVARACCLALDSSEAAGDVFNVGSGRTTTVRQVAQLTAEVLGCPEFQPDVTGKARVGDIRHCFADITKARRILGYEPQVELRAGLAALADWLRTQTAVDNTATMQHELQVRGLAA